MPLAPSSTKHSSHHQLDWLLPTLILLAGLAVTWIVQDNNTQNALQDAEQKFEVTANQTALAIESHVASYEQVLLGVQGLFMASQSIGRKEFSAYCYGLDLPRFYPGMAGLGFAQVIPANQRIAHTLQTGKEGDREIYSSVVYLEPQVRSNVLALG